MKPSYFVYTSAAFSFLVGMLADFNNDAGTATEKYLKAIVWMLIAFRLEREKL